MYIITIIVFGIHLTPVWICLHEFIKDISECKLTEYAITNQRIIIKGGPNKSDIFFVQLKNIQELNLNSDYIDSLF